MQDLPFWAQPETSGRALARLNDYNKSRQWFLIVPNMVVGSQVWSRMHYGDSNIVPGDTDIICPNQDAARKQTDVFLQNRLFDASVVQKGEKYVVTTKIGKFDIFWPPYGYSMFECIMGFPHIFQRVAMDFMGNLVSLRTPMETVIIGSAYGV